MSDSEEETIVLEGEEATNLWLKGKDKWNEWVSRNPNAHVNFRYERFGDIARKNKRKNIDFSKFNFPSGVVTFADARFGDYDVEFIYATFGDGNISFADATFGKGAVHFYGTTFGKGDVSFHRTLFGEGNVSFHGATFGDGSVIFAETTFGEGNVSFSGATFGKGKVSFKNVLTNSGQFYFGPFYVMDCKSLNFSNSYIESVFQISGIKTSSVINLQGTRLTHPVDLDNADIGFQSTRFNLIFRKAIDPSDSTSFRRLKKLAQEAGDHERVLDFYAKEMRSAYWHSITGPKLALYYLYDWISDYGRSILRPIIALFVSWIIYSVIYLAAVPGKDLSNTLVPEEAAIIGSALKFSYGHTFLIYPGTRESRGLAIEDLFGKDFENAPWWIPVTSFTQYVISSVLIFLILLALRNRFRT